VGCASDCDAMGIGDAMAVCGVEGLVGTFRGGSELLGGCEMLGGCEILGANGAEGGKSRRSCDTGFTKIISSESLFTRISTLQLEVIVVLDTLLLVK